LIHLVEKKDTNFDEFIKKEFEKNIIEKYQLSLSDLRTNLLITNSGLECVLILNFHQEKEHYVFTEDDSDIYVASSKILDEVEKAILKNKRSESYHLNDMKPSDADLEIVNQSQQKD